MHPEYQYLNLLKDVLDNGEDKPVFGNPDVFVRSVFGRQLRFDLSKGFPIYTTKKVFYRGAFEEMLWFLKDGGNVTKLIQKGVHIWDEWAWKYWKTLANDRIPEHDFASQDELTSYLADEDVPFYIPIHYTNFTNWNDRLDQMNWVVTNLPKKPERKSYYVTCWNPEEAYQMADECDRESVILVACHTDHIVNVTGGKLNLRVTIRSNDLFLGSSFNAAQYAMLTHMYAKLCGFPVGDLVVNIDDAHIYSNHFEQVREQISREPLPFPQLEILDRGQKKMQDFEYSDFKITGYESRPPIKGDITVVGGY